MNPVIALLLSKSIVSAVTDAEVTTLTNAVQSKVGTDPAAAANSGAGCTNSQASRPIENTQAVPGTGTWPYNTCESACFTSDKVEASAIGQNIATADIPTWTVDLGGEYVLTDVSIITAQSESGTYADGTLTPTVIEMSDSDGTTWADTGAAFGASETPATVVEKALSSVKGNKVRLTAQVVPEAGAVKEYSIMKFCGFKAYGTKTAIQDLLDAQTVLVNAQTVLLNAQISLLSQEVTATSTATTTAQTCDGELTTLNTELSPITTQKTDLGTERDGYIAQQATLKSQEDTCRADYYQLGEEYDASYTEYETLIGDKQTLVNAKSALVTAKTALQTEMGTLVSDITGVEAVIETYINPDEDCGNFKIFGRKYCSIPKTDE